MRRLIILLGVLALLSFGACGDDDEPTVEDNRDAEAATGLTEVRFEADDFSYSMPKEIKGGYVEFTMENVGKELHIAAFARIADGKTFADVTKDLSSPTPPADPSSHEVGGIASTSPGSTSNVALALEPGTYYVVCFIPSADGVPHVAKGMVQPFEVTESADAPPDLPAVDVTMTAVDFSYESADELVAGEQVVELDNEGSQGHEITLLEFAEGKGPADLQAFFDNPTGPPPATFFGGPFIGEGLTARWTTPPLAAGRSYFFMCLIPDPADGVPHALKGMVLPVTVT